MLTNKERIKIISRIEIKLRDVINSRIRNSETDDDKKKNEGKLWENFYIKNKLTDGKQREVALIVTWMIVLGRWYTLS